MLLTRKIVIRTISNKENDYSTRQERHKGPEVYTLDSLATCTRTYKKPNTPNEYLEANYVKKIIRI